jgi:hypothetical protein
MFTFSNEEYADVHFVYRFSKAAQLLPLRSIGNNYRCATNIMGHSHILLGMLCSI